MPTLTFVTTRSDLQAASTSLGVVELTEPGREGAFRWSASNLSTLVTADPNQGVYVPPSGGNGSTGAWVRIVTDGYVSFDAFGAVGDGSTNDYAAIRAAVNLQRAVASAWRLRGRQGATYYVGTPSTPLIALNYDNAYVDLNGATVKFAANAVGPLFQVGNNNYVPGSNVALPGPITIRGGTIDLNRGAQFGNCISLRFPARDILVEDMVFRQSGIAAGQTPNAGDQWAIVMENYPSSYGSLPDYADENARLHNVTVRRCRSSDTMQLAAGAGQGINGLKILDNYVYEPRANGIAITGLGRVTRIDDVVISRNTVVRANGRGIYLNHDNIGDFFSVEVGQVGAFQSYCRNVVISDNVLVDCSEGIRVGHYIQGGFNITLDNNVITNHSDVITRSDGLTITPIGSITSVGLAMRWRNDYHGGSDPTIAASSFDSSTDVVTLTAHNLPTGGGVFFTPLPGAAMPAGVAAGVPYFVKKESADSFSLWERVDATTGTLLDQVNIGSGASGSFSVGFITIVQDMIIGAGNIATGGHGVRLASIRASRIDGRLGHNFQFGMLADCEIGGIFTGPVRGDQGGTLRVRFTPSAEFRMRTTSLSTDLYMVRLADDVAFPYNYDVEFHGCHVSVDGTASASTAAPLRFLKDMVTPANRYGRGWAATGLTFSLPGVGNGFTSFYLANPDNCWKFDGWGSAQTSTERFGGTATPMRHRYIRAGDLPSVAAGGSATVDIACLGMRAAEDGKTAIAVRPMNNKGNFTSLILSAHISADDVIRVTAFNPTSAAIDPPSSNFLFVVEGYR